MSAKNLQELLVEEIRDIYDAEKQLVKALPKMVKAAESGELRSAFEDHLEVSSRATQRPRVRLSSRTGMAVRGRT